MQTELIDTDVLEEVKPEITPRELFDVVMNERRLSLFFDIETMPADESIIRSFYDESKIKLPAYPGMFDPSKVKFGNMKDPEKRRAKMAEDMAKHQAALFSWEDDCHQAKEEAWQKFLADATLSPLTSRVCAIGYGIRRGSEVQVCLDIDSNDERGMLIRFWKLVELIKKRSGKLVSFNGHKFDIPYCTIRTWAYEDVTPVWLMTQYNKMENFCIDCLEKYQMGRGWNAMVKLDHLDKMMGGPGKIKGMTGDMFHKVLKENHDKAEEYLAEDIFALARVAGRMQLA